MKQDNPTTYTQADLEAVYALALPVALAELRRGATRIGVDWLTGEVRRLHQVGGSNNMRPALAQLLRDRHPELKPLIRVGNTRRGPTKRVTAADLKRAFEQGVAWGRQHPAGTP